MEREENLQGKDQNQIQNNSESNTFQRKEHKRARRSQSNSRSRSKEKNQRKRERSRSRSREKRRSSRSKEKERTQTKRFAYVTLVFGSRFYIPPALVLGYSLQKFKNKDIDVVCMVTYDVSSPDRQLLSNYFDRIIEVDYLRKKTVPFTIRKMLRYNSFQDNLYTKWRCLELTQYEKVLFLDADMFVIRDPSNVFQFQTPGGVLICGNSKRLGGTLRDSFGELQIGKRYKVDLSGNSKIPPAQTVLLTPSRDDFDKLQKILNENDVFQTKPFVFNGGDEVVLSRLYPEWIHMGAEYLYDWTLNTCRDKSYSLQNGFKPFIMSARGENKIWTKKSAEWEDEKLWFEIAEKLPEFKDFTSFRDENQVTQ